MYSFYEITGEIPDSIVDIACDMFEFQSDAIPAPDYVEQQSTALLNLVEMLLYISYAIIFI